MNVKGCKGDNQYLGSPVVSKVTYKNLLTLSLRGICGADTK